MILALEIRSEPVGRGERGEPRSSRHAARCAAASWAWREGDSRQARTLSPVDPSSFASPHLHQIFTASCPSLDARTFLKPPSSPSSPHQVHLTARPSVTRSAAPPASLLPISQSGTARGDPSVPPHPLSPLPTPWWWWRGDASEPSVVLERGRLCTPRRRGCRKAATVPFLFCWGHPGGWGWGPPGPAPPLCRRPG